jgi:hypothetical protein
MLIKIRNTFWNVRLGLLTATLGREDAPHVKDAPFNACLLIRHLPATSALSGIDDERNSSHRLGLLKGWLELLQAPATQKYVGCNT